jgi:hypothetical protein
MLVSEPSDSGMVPLSWLELKSNTLYVDRHINHIVHSVGVALSASQQ